MRWARLLNAPERVEVLQIDRATEEALIQRHGFTQKVSLRELVFEEEELPPTRLDIPSAFQVLLELKVGQKEATFLLCAGDMDRFCALYLRSKGFWHPVYQGILSAYREEACPISCETHPPPWQLVCITVPISVEALPHRPAPSIQEATLRPLFFTQSGKLLIPFESSKKQAEPNFPINSFTQKLQNLEKKAEIGPILDLHIEKLAPHLKNDSADVIFSYQLRALEQYIDKAQRCGYGSVVIIHGIGNLRLRKAVEAFCQEEGFRFELLTFKPYDGGATRLYLTR